MEENRMKKKVITMVACGCTMAMFLSAKPAMHVHAESINSHDFAIVSVKDEQAHESTKAAIIAARESLAEDHETQEELKNTKIQEAKSRIATSNKQATIEETKGSSVPAELEAAQAKQASSEKQAMKESMQAPYITMEEGEKTDEAANSSAISRANFAETETGYARVKLTNASKKATSEKQAMKESMKATYIIKEEAEKADEVERAAAMARSTVTETEAGYAKYKLAGTTGSLYFKEEAEKASEAERAAAIAKATVKETEAGYAKVKLARRNAYALKAQSDFDSAITRTSIAARIAAAEAAKNAANK